MTRLVGSLSLAQFGDIVELVRAGYDADQISFMRGICVDSLRRSFDVMHDDGSLSQKMEDANA